MSFALIFHNVIVKQAHDDNPGKAPKAFQMALDCAFSNPAPKRTIKITGQVNIAFMIN